MLATERSSLVHDTPKLPRGVGWHLLSSLAMLIIPAALSIAMLASERSSPSHLMPWSTSSVGWGVLKGDLTFSLTQFALCKTGDPNSCAAFQYQGQPMLGQDGEDIYQAGRSVVWMMSIATAMLGISSGFTFWSLVKREGPAATSCVKVSSWVMSLLGAILLVASALVWSSSIHDRLLNFTEVHYSWGFALTVVAGGLAGFAALLQCLRPAGTETPWA